MNDSHLNRLKKRIFPGKGITFGKMWLATPHFSRFRAKMDITGLPTEDAETDDDD